MVRVEVFGSNTERSVSVADDFFFAAANMSLLVSPEVNTAGMSAYGNLKGRYWL